jgi:tRNA A-37 threonylcarbamoyl transferase component Bud32
MTATRIVLAPGETLGGYRVLDVIGVGGMAIVYKAEQTSLGRPVALKVLSAKLSRDEAFRERFRSEGKNVALLDHPHIVSVYDSGEVDGQLFLAMRLVEGETLAERLTGRGLSADETLRILGPIADALDAAHGVGVVHRDVKPQNILLSESGHPYLADFGVCKGVHGGSLTATGGFVGSFNYAAPEQFLGESATAATDVYALAVVVFQCLTGGLPSTRDTDADLMTAYVNEGPAPRATALAVGSEFNKMIACGMANDPDRRYERASSLLAATAAVVNKLSNKQRRAVPAFAVSLAEGSGSAGSGVSDAAHAALSSAYPAAARRVLAARGTAGQQASPDDTFGGGAEIARVPQVRSGSSLSLALASSGRRSRRAPAILIGIAAVAIIALAVVLGRDAGVVTKQEHSRSGPVAIAYRAPWHAVAGAVAGSFAIRAPIRLASGPETLAGGSLVDSAAVPGDVPPQLLARYGHPSSQASVRVARRRGRRYSWQLGGRRQLVAFVIPTSGADISIVCDGQGSVSSCSDLAIAAKVSGAQPLAPGPVTWLVDALKRDLAPVLASRERLIGLGASTLPDRARAAGTIADLERSTAAKLSALAVPPRYKPLLSKLIQAIKAEAHSFVSLGAAAAGNQRGEYARTRASVTVASRQLASTSHAVRRGGLAIRALAALQLPAPPALPVQPPPAPVQPAPAPVQPYIAPAETYTVPAPTYTAPIQPYTVPPQPIAQGSGSG